MLSASEDIVPTATVALTQKTAANLWRCLCGGLIILIAIARISSAYAVELMPVEQHVFQEWEALLYRNENSGRLLCAVESQSNGTTYRINHYRDSGETFIEFLNPQWGLLEGSARLSLEFSGKNGLVDLQMMGMADRSAYFHDILEVKKLQVLFGLMSLQSRVKLINSNGAQLGEFSLKGAGDALSHFANCMKSKEVN